MSRCETIRRFLVRLSGSSSDALQKVVKLGSIDVYRSGTHLFEREPSVPPDTTLRETPVRAVTIALLGGLALLGSCRDGRDSVTAPPLGQPTFPPTPPAQLAQITGRIAFVSTRDGSPHIYVADSASVTRLTPGERPSWSLDGRRIAFHRCSGLPVCRGPLEIHVIDADGSNERVLGPGANPAWSPDGFRIAFEWPGGMEAPA
jgi:hypothetical protein